jgi:uncharacterized protein YndB with AHSA1/START domain
MTDDLINELTITRTFAAPRELVYEAWTRPEHFAVWFGSAAIEVPLDTVSMDVRVGGEWKAVMLLPDGKRINWIGEYIEVDPPARLAFTMTDDPANPTRVPVVVTLDEVDGGTEMTLVQTGSGFTAEQQAMTIAGYNSFFDDMEKVLAGLTRH